MGLLIDFLRLRSDLIWTYNIRFSVLQKHIPNWNYSGYGYG